MNIEADPSKVSDILSFIDFVKSLEKEFDEKTKIDFNTNTIDFLEALSRYAEDIQAYYDNTNQKINANIPTWRIFADLLKGASLYE
jgi:hypothetical protein